MTCLSSAATARPKQRHNSRGQRREQRHNGNYQRCFPAIPGSGQSARHYSPQDGAFSPRESSNPDCRMRSCTTINPDCQEENCDLVSNSPAMRQVGGMRCAFPPYAGFPASSGRSMFLFLSRLLHHFHNSGRVRDARLVLIFPAEHFLKFSKETFLKLIK